MVIAAVALTLLGACGPDRPTSDEWAGTWATARSIVPSESELAERGRDLCDRVLGEMRVGFDDLDPTPSPTLDDVVRAWTELAERIAFECPRGAELTARMTDLDRLATEIDAGIDGD